MREQYKTIELEIIRFENEDIITESNPDSEHNEGEDTD